MKKLALIMTLSVAFSTLGVTAFAEEATSVQDQAGIKPDSILYPLDKAYDSLRVTLASGEENKAEVISEVAEERLGESEAMTEAGKTDLATAALNEYSDSMTEAGDLIKTAVDNTEETATQSDLQKLNDIENKIMERQKKALEVLKTVESKVAENAKETISKVIEMQTAKKEAVANMIEKRHQLNTIKQELNELKAQLETAKQAGDTVAISNLEDQIKLKEQEILVAKDAVKQAMEAKKDVNKDLKVGTGNQEKSKDVKPEDVKNKEKQAEEKSKDNSKVVEEKSKENSKPAEKQNNTGDVKKQESKPVVNQGQPKVEQPKPEKGNN